MSSHNSNDNIIYFLGKYLWNNYFKRFKVVNIVNPVESVFDLLALSILLDLILFLIIYCNILKMESLFIILIIISTTIYVYMLFNNQLYNRKCFIKRKKELEEYSEVVNNKKSSFVYKNVNLEKILNDYNSKKKDFLENFIF